jgi:hypothetical protein
MLNKNAARVARCFRSIPKKNTKQEKDVQTKMEMVMLCAGHTSICTENGWQIMM